ncbi:hypothetical protein GOODEAATRI_026913, partial [Goodea atripinnis]
ASCGCSNMLAFSINSFGLCDPPLCVTSLRILAVISLTAASRTPVGSLSVPVVRSVLVFWFQCRSRLVPLFVVTHHPDDSAQRATGGGNPVTMTTVQKMENGRTESVINRTMRMEMLN